MMFTLSLTEPELQALAGLLDAAIRATGIRSHEPAYQAVIAKVRDARPGPVAGPGA